MALDRRKFIGTSLVALNGGAIAMAAPAGPVLGTKPAPAPGGRLDARSRLPAAASDAIATHIVGLRYADLDAATVAKAKHRVLDLIGCAIGGAAEETIPALIAAVTASDAKPEASIIGYPARVSVAQAAMTNATIARAYDFEVMTVVVDDLQVPSHHSPTTCMTALAFAEQGRASGQDFLTALVMADDLAARLLAASGLDFGQGWDGAPVYSALPATAIAARFLGLSVLQARDALGHSVDTIAGTVQNIWDGAADWKLPQGLVARNAVLSAQLAKGGWAGLADPLLAPYGFFAQYTAGCVRPELLTTGLGKRFYAEEYFKPYPACYATHATIECALALRSTSRVAADDVVEIVIGLSEPALNVFVSKPFEARRDPHCDANFSHQFMAANALLHGGLRQEHLTAAAIRSAPIARLIGASRLEALPRGESGVLMTVRLRDGRVVTQRHPGMPSRNPRLRPSTEDEIVAKFRQQVAFSGYVPAHVADEIIRRVARLEEEADMAAFVQMLTQTSLPMGVAL